MDWWSNIVIWSRLPYCLPGFTKRSESVYDPFGAGHSSTSVSAALGMAVGRGFKGRKNNVIAVSCRLCDYFLAASYLVVYCQLLVLGVLAYLLCTAHCQDMAFDGGALALI